MIPTCYVASKQVRDIRNVLRERLYFVRLRTMTKNRITTIFDRYPEERKNLRIQTDLFGKKGREQLNSLNMREADRALIDRELNFIDLINSFIQEVEEVIEDNLKETKNVKILRSIPGIGKFFSALIDAEIGDIYRFKDEKKLASYCGLVPSTYSSGGITHHGALIKTSNKYLRWAFIEAVIPAVRSDEYLRFEYELLRKRMNWNKAKTAMARKLMVIAYRCLKDGRSYKKLNKLELERHMLRRSA